VPDRTYDVLAFHGAAARGEVLLDQSLVASGGSVCTGGQKLAQWFTVELLTARGSLPYAPERGTRFLPELVAGRLRSETDVLVAFGFAVGDIRASAAQLETAATPDDERLAAATADRVVILPGVVRLHITITSRAGAARSITLPVATTPAA
jgi:hypothetical protein